MQDDEIMRYRKKAQKNTPKKSNHKHEYVNCVYGFNGQKFSRERGFEPVPELSIGTYCPVCGKIGTTYDEGEGRWVEWGKRGPLLTSHQWTDEAKREFDESTRTLPYFWVDDNWFQKYVELNPT